MGTHQGQYKGMAYTTEEISMLEKVDDMDDIDDEERASLDSDWSSSSDHFHHTDFHKVVTFHEFTFVLFYADWCIHCRQFHPVWNKAAERFSEKTPFQDGDGRSTTVKFLKMNCVDFADKCRDVNIPAFPTLRLYKRDGTFETFKQKRSMEVIMQFLASSVKNSHYIVMQHHNMFSEGCQVQGQVQVPRVPGHFALQAAAHGNVSVNPALTNVSHDVNHLSFGSRESKSWAERQNIPREMITHIDPLDGKSFTVAHFHEAPQHYLKVVSTHIDGQQGAFYQMTHSDRMRKFRDAAEKVAAPQASFSYDFSPMSVVVKVKARRWYEFITSLFAILGGTYTIIELTSGAVDTVSTAVKEALGKAN